MSGFPSVLLFGAGKMGGAVLKGALRAGWPANKILVIEPSPSPELQEQQRQAKFHLNSTVNFTADLVLLAVKPQMLDQIVAPLSPFLNSSTILISILAGKSVENLAQRFPMLTKIIRAMPNTPAAIGRGATGLYATPSVSTQEKQGVNRLLATLGLVEWLEEEVLIDALTALSGSGPGYVFYFVEAMTQAGIHCGLSPEMAGRLARVTLEGAGELLFQEKAVTPAQLRANVTSPGGTTAAGLDVLMDEKSGLTPLLTQTIAAALARAKALAG